VTDLSKVQRGQVWLIDFEPQTHKQEPGKRGLPALVIQTNVLNDSGHPTTIVIPCTTQVYRDAQGDGYPIRISLGEIGKSKVETDFLVDQIRAIANERILGAKPLAELPRVLMKRIEGALKILTT
jgi:mRNA interferase MazF